MNVLRSSNDAHRHRGKAYKILRGSGEEKERDAGTEMIVVPVEGQRNRHKDKRVNSIGKITLFF